ncbi:LytTR family DNA-binding domain-containing protein [Silanimonas sp.]|jgi:two-component system response regulator AlgR|uniref:LytR/AlgR family response regulator transcription factor n=1 Tax=Silanimonas sp. TaxID=1929290 RepID=UPI0022C82B6F|nr:LytTR family DNA-binding domain-containing protein [Silanimonas sp.]MCZ8061671.1 LytTR family DNA-binding domain-containing protein [Silanimonas sp.]
MDVLIADDEPLARERLAALLAELGGHRVVAAVGDGRSALDACLSQAPDVVLMDIEMPEMDGLEAARHLAGMESPPAVVFCTAYDEHALAAFEAAAVDYLLKPVRAERLAAALQRAAERRAGRKQAVAAPALSGRARTHLAARLRGSLRLIPVADIRYLQAEEKYVVVHHARGEDLVEDSLKGLEAEFAGRFLRIHRNCLVAREQFSELRRSPEGVVHAVLRDGGAVLEVSRRCLPALRDELKHL